MPSWQIPGVPSVPTWADVVRMVQMQTEVLSELPETISDLQETVRGLSQAVDEVRETILTTTRVVTRLESLIDDLEDPVRGLRPGIERVSDVLEAPVIQRLPVTLEAVEATVLPIARSASRIRRRLTLWSGWVRSIRYWPRSTAAAEPKPARLPGGSVPPTD